MIRCGLSRNEENLGKGAAINNGLAHATGDLVVVQDADLEYSPDDYKLMLPPVLNGETNIVYGARKIAHLNLGTLSFAARIIFTQLLNLLYGSKLSDLNTCYKMFKRDFLNTINLESKGFGFCSEVTAKALCLGEKIVEVEVNYNPRYRDAGKKITPLDGFPILLNLFYYKLFFRTDLQRVESES